MEGINWGAKMMINGIYSVANTKARPKGIMRLTSISVLFTYSSHSKRSIFSTLHGKLTFQADERKASRRHRMKTYKLELAASENVSVLLLGPLQLLDDLLVDPEQLDSVLALNDNLLALAEEIFCLADDTSRCWRSGGGGGIKAALGSDRSNSS